MCWSSSDRVRQGRSVPKDWHRNRGHPLCRQRHTSLECPYLSKSCPSEHSFRVDSLIACSSCCCLRITRVACWDAGQGYAPRYYLSHEDIIIYCAQLMHDTRPIIKRKWQRNYEGSVGTSSCSQIVKCVERKLQKNGSGGAWHSMQGASER